MIWVFTLQMWKFVGKFNKELSINKTFDKQVDIGFNVMASYGDGKELIGSFGFNKIYKNQVEYRSSMFILNMREFSPPPDLDTYIIKETNKPSKEYKVGYDDSFTNYLNYVTKKLKNEKQSLNKEFLNKIMNLKNCKIMKKQQKNKCLVIFGRI